MRSSNPHFKLIAACFLIAIIFWASPLSFFPVPWADDSVYLLAGAELFQWPPIFRMHSQSMAVPTYEIANFNNMPLLPTLIGFSDWIGIKSVHALRIYGMLVMAAWCSLLTLWLKRREMALAWTWLFVFAALTSPVIRWAAMPVHPEVWQGLLWLLMLFELSGSLWKLSLWRLALYLALAAGFHFQAIVWVLPVIVGLYPFSEDLPRSRKIWLWVMRLWGTCWRVILFMSPWIAYVIYHWDIFWVQMYQQFGRLAEPHPHISSWHSFFHSLFLETGNPISYPKFYNLGKILFWLVLTLSAIRTARLAWREQEERGMRWAALTALGTTLVLWLDKPESWFILLIHMAAFPVMILAGWRTRMIALLLFVLVGVQIGVAGYQWGKANEHMRWSYYRDWVACIEQELGERTKIWEPSALDVLVNLHIKRPRLDYWGHNCFPEHKELIAQHMERVEAVVHTLNLPFNDPHVRDHYQGPLREIDIQKVTEYPWLQYREYSAPRMGPPWVGATCQKGPFWAVVSKR